MESSKSLSGNSNSMFLEIARSNPHAVPTLTVKLIKPTVNAFTYSQCGAEMPPTRLMPKTSQCAPHYWLACDWIFLSPPVYVQPILTDNERQRYRIPGTSKTATWHCLPGRLQLPLGKTWKMGIEVRSKMCAWSANGCETGRPGCLLAGNARFNCSLSLVVGNKYGWDKMGDEWQS